MRKCLVVVPLLVLACWIGFVFAGDLSQINSAGKFFVKAEKQDAVLLKYSITNMSEKEMWICDSISGWGESEYFTTVSDGKLYINIKSFDLPIFTEEAVNAYYSKLEKSDTNKFKIYLPVNLSISYNFDDPKKDEVNLSRVKTVYLNVGYFNDLPADIPETDKVNSNKFKVNNVSSLCGKDEILCVPLSLD